MKFERVKFTADTVRGLTLPAGKADHVYWDSIQPGFGYRVFRSSASKRGGQIWGTWIIQYRNKQGKSRRMTVAHGTLPVAAARKKAVELLASAKTGHDPQGEKEAERGKSSELFEAMAKTFYEFGCKYGIKNDNQPWRPNTFRQYDYVLFDYLKPYLHGKEIHAITRVHIALALNEIQKERGTHAAWTTQCRLSTFFKWAMGEGIIDINPVVASISPRNARPSWPSNNWPWFGAP